MEFRNLTPERKAGIAFTVAVVAILGLIALMLGTSRARGFEYTVIVKDGKGLRKGDRVQLNGVDIGTVRGVNLDRTGESIRVELEIEREHREKIRSNSTAYIRDATFPNVSGQKIVEVLNSASPSPPLPPKSVVKGKESIAEVKAWQFSEQVGTWSEQLSSMVGDLTEAARSGFQRGKEAWQKQQEEQSRKALERLRAAAEDENRKELEAPSPETPFNESGYAAAPEPAPADDTATTAPEDSTPRFQTDQPGLAGASDLLKQYKSSEEYQELADRTVNILKRLSDRGVTSALAQIILDWKELKKELVPAIQVLRDAGKLALAEQLDGMMRAVDEMIRQRQQEQGQQPGGPPLVKPTPETLRI